MDRTSQRDRLIKWNRKVHIYLGLFLLLFIWLFGISGVLLNHHWEFANSWEKRKVASYDKVIELSSERDKHVLVHEILNKLDLNGNIINLRYSADSANLNFLVVRPGIRYDLQATLEDGRIMVKETMLDQWAALQALHKLRNPTQKELADQYQPVLSFIWGISMDIVSIGLIVICLGGWYMWFQVPKKRFYFGLLSIFAGLILCACILFF